MADGYITRSFFFTSAVNRFRWIQSREEAGTINAVMQVPIEIKSGSVGLEVGITMVSIWDAASSGTSSFFIQDVSQSLSRGISINGEYQGILAVVPKAACADFRPKNITWVDASNLEGQHLRDFTFALTNEQCEKVQAVGAWSFMLLLRYKPAPPPYEQRLQGLPRTIGLV